MPPIEETNGSVTQSIEAISIVIGLIEVQTEIWLSGEFLDISGIVLLLDNKQTL